MRFRGRVSVKLFKTGRFRIDYLDHSHEYLVVLDDDGVVTDGWLGQLIALANAKGDFTAERAERAETKTGGEREGRPAVDSGAGSGDPRTAREKDSRA
jgi:hypothetical protein